MSRRVKLIGSHYSPYSRKMRAYLRYKRIPYEWIQMRFDEPMKLNQPKYPLVPVIYLSDENFEIPHVDSTPIIRMMEANQDGEDFSGRRVLPPSTLLHFLNDLVEDYADEWVTKFMMHYRWSYDGDKLKASRILANSLTPSFPQDKLDEAVEDFRTRQVGRLKDVIGSNRVNAPFIEKEYKDMLRNIDNILKSSSFLFGSAPSSADFALYGQLTQLSGFDPTPSQLATEISPRVCAWVDACEDLSGLENNSGNGWLTEDQLMTSSPHQRFLKSIGRTYIPFLKANNDAHLASEAQFSCKLGSDLHLWSQNTFTYQSKCWKTLQHTFNNLNNEDKRILSTCSIYF